MANLTGDRAKDHVCIELPMYGTPMHYYVSAFGTSAPDYTGTWSSMMYVLGFMPGCSYLSNTQTHMIMAAEADPSGPYIWFLKDGDSGDRLCTMWDASGPDLIYANHCIGTGWPGIGDDTWIEARDVTIGEQNTLYILDYYEATFTTKIKGFNISDSTPVGSVKVNGIVYEPQRLDGSKELGMLVLLDGYPPVTQTNHGRLYVFTANDTPPN
jgi:hypothetical protein